MKLYLINLLLFVGSIFIGKAQNWVDVDHEASNFSVQMPLVPKYIPENVYTLNGIAKKITYSTEYDDVEIVFEIQEILGSNKKADKNAISNLIKNSTIAHHGNNPKVSKLKKGDISYTYVEIPLITGELIRSVVVTQNGFIHQVYIKGIITNVFNETANKYLESWNVSTIQNTDNELQIENEDPKTSESISNDEKNTWINLSIEPNLEVKFPAQPFKKSTLIENGLNDIEITSYAFTDRENGKTYVVSIRPYTRDQGQLTNASIYSYYLDRIKGNKKLKLTNEELIDRPNEGIEYVFSKGIRFYRLKLFRVDNVMYQFLIKGKRKNIYNLESEYFFNNFNFLN